MRETIDIWGLAPACSGHAAAAVLDARWPEAVAGSLAPDAWPLFGGARSQMHALVKDDPATWHGAVERWLDAAPAVRPGRGCEAATAAFLLGYVTHLCLDTWSLYLDPALPAAARRESPDAWFPAVLREEAALPAALLALGEAPIPVHRQVAPAALACAFVPDGFDVAATRKLGAGVAPALPERDPWRISRANPIRPRPDTPEAKREWDARRAAFPEASPEQVAALVGAALNFTRRAVERWW